MLVRIEDIKIKKRIRKENTSIDSLADSMRVYGLFNPIVLDTDYMLIAGLRRQKNLAGQRFLQPL